MHSFYTDPIYMLFIAAIALQAGLAVCMWCRDLQRRYPAFFAYTIFQVCTAPFTLLIFRYFIKTQPGVYFYFYWGKNACAILLGFACAYEVFSRILSEYESLQKLKAPMFRWAAALLLLGGAALAAWLPVIRESAVATLTMQMDRTLRIVQAGLLVLLLCFASYLGMTWRNRAFGIALGFGFYAMVKLVVLSIVLQAGWRLTPSMNLFQEISYVVSVIIWLSYMLAPERVPAKTISMHQPGVEQWNRTLEEMLNS